MNHGVFVPPFDELAEPRRLLELAVLAEHRGWDGFFLWDHVQRPEVRPVGDPWILLAAVAAVTERMRLGPMVTPMVRRRPQKLAREVVTLDRLSRGRLVLGLGLGVDTGRELTAFGEVTDVRERADMLDEGLGLLSGLLSGQAVDHAGAHFDAHDVRFLPTPLQGGGVPIWLAARTTAARPLRRAAAHDGVFIIEQPPESISSMLEVVAGHRGSLEGFEVATVAPRGADPGRFSAAGVTWWMTSGLEGAPAEDLFALVEAGPPR